MSLRKNYTITLDDDPSISKLIEKYSGIPTIPFATIEDLLAGVANLKPSAAFIDINLNNNANGLTLLPTLRQYWPYCPLIVVTSETDSNTLSEAFVQGADDFVRKPIDKAEFNARLNIRLKDSSARNEKKNIRLSDLTFNTENGTLKGNKKTEYLAPTIQRLLFALYEQRGLVATHEQLKNRVWNNVNVTDNALDRKLSELRKAFKALDSKIEIKNVYGKGFLLVLEEKTPVNNTATKKGCLPHLVPSFNNTQIKVLLLEGTEASAAQIRTLLKNSSPVIFDIKWKSNLKEAKEALKEGNIDAILVNLNLEDSKGTDTFKTLLESHSQTPILLLNGDYSDETAEECIALGAQDYLNYKEMNSTLLSKAIRYSIARNRVKAVQLSQAYFERDQAEKRNSQTENNVSAEEPLPASLPVLLVEDNPVNQLMATRMLEKMGIEVETVSDGKEAVRAVEKNCYSLIFMDCLLTEMDGFEATEIIRSKKISTPIVAMTGNTAQGDKEKCTQSGMNDFLSKPLETAALEKICDRWLSFTSLNPERLRQLEELNTKDSPHFINEIFQLFLSNAPATFLELENAYRHSDTDKVRRQAHRLKGMAFNIGALRVVSLCQQLEDAGKKANLNNCDRLMKRTALEMNAVVRFIMNRMNQTTSLAVAA